MTGVSRREGIGFAVARRLAEAGTGVFTGTSISGPLNRRIRLFVVVTGIDWMPGRRSGQSSFSMPSTNATMRPLTEGSLMKMPTELLCR